MSAMSYLSLSLLGLAVLFFSFSTPASAATYNVSIEVNVTTLGASKTAAVVAGGSSISASSSAGQAREVVEEHGVGARHDTASAVARSVLVDAGYASIGEMNDTVVWNESDGAGYWQAPVRTVVVTETRTVTRTVTETRSETVEVPAAPTEVGGPGPKAAVALLAALLLPLALLVLARR